MKKYIIVGIIFTFIIFICIFLFTRVPKLDIDNVDTLTLITLPSPPKYKDISDRKDMKTWIDYINSLDLSPTINFDKGWWFMIKINEDTTISFLSDFVHYNNRAYKINNPDYENTLKSLYDSMDYEEKDWGH